MNDILKRRPVKPDRIVRYGEAPQQFAELRFPEGDGPDPLLFVIHGGFWRNLYDLSHVSHLCAALTRKGIVTCNLEYRRVGDPQGGWPGTFQDIVDGTDRIIEELRSEKHVDVSQKAVLGHSAGGHLALWLTSVQSVPEESELFCHPTHRIPQSISLAGICDLRQAWRDNLGNGSVAKLMGGSPDELPKRYRAANPIELLPTGGKQILIHGTEDEIVPISQSETFAQRGKALGADTSLVELKDTGHFELIDPESDGWKPVERTVISLFREEAEE